MFPLPGMFPHAKANGVELNTGSIRNRENPHLDRFRLDCGIDEHEAFTPWRRVRLSGGNSSIRIGGSIQRVFNCFDDAIVLVTKCELCFDGTDWSHFSVFPRSHHHLQRILRSRTLKWYETTAGNFGGARNSVGRS